MEERLKVLLYNAISLLTDETFDSFDEASEWYDWLCDELGTDDFELKELGIEIFDEEFEDEI